MSTNTPKVPTPPLPYWPEPPSNEGIFEEPLLLASDGDSNSIDLLDQLLRLTRLRQRLNAHYQQVVTWTELCHSESESHGAAIHNGKDWLEYVRRIKTYLNNNVSHRSTDVEKAIMSTYSELSRVRDALTGRVEQLEQEHEQVRDRLRRLNSSE